MDDLRLVEIKQRDSMAFGVKEIVAAVVGAGVTLIVGLLVYSKISQGIDTSSFTAAQNTTLASIKTNVESGFSLTSVMPIVIAAAGLLAVLFVAFR